MSRSARLFFALTLTFVLAACDEPEVPLAHGDNLQFLGTFDLEVREPSGVSLAADGESLWINSDEAGTIHRVNLRGEPLENFQADVKDVEGITSLGEDQLAVIGERGRKLVVLDTSGKRLAEQQLNVPGDDNTGPEGVTYNVESRELYVIKEKNPGLFLALDENLEEIGRAEFRFARDYSGLAFESVRKHLWVLSDESQSIHVLDREMNVAVTFSTNIVQAEGLAVDYPNKRLFIVSDATAKLYVFSFDDY